MKQDSSIRIDVKTSISEVNQQDWETIRKGRNIYLSFPYLQALQSSVSGNMDFFYVLIYRNNQPILKAVFQLVDFVYKGGKHGKVLLNVLCKRKIQEGYNIGLLVGGNIFANGENCASWIEELTHQEALNLVFESVEQLRMQPRVREKMSVVLFKEFSPKYAEQIKALNRQRYTSFEIDVSMILSMNEGWTTFNKYLQDQKTKFRTRAKGVYKKSKALQSKWLSADDIRQQENEIVQLFSNVLERSDYGFGAIEPLSFAAFKEAFPDDFSFEALYLEDKMVGFKTSFLNRGNLEANYVGIDYELNHEHAIYQRLLYDYVKEAIDKKVRKLNLGRTSETMKSLLGAQPVPMTLYARHKSAFTNKLLSWALGYVGPSEYELRLPFKQEFQEQWTH